MAEDETLPPWPEDAWGRFASQEGFGHRTFWVRPRHMAETHPRIERLHRWRALGELDRWIADAGSRTFLELLHEREHGPPVAGDARDRWQIIVDELTDDIGSGRLVLHAEREPAPAPGTVPVEPTPPRPPAPKLPREPTAWIEIHLVDEADAVVVDEVVSVVDPLGARQHVRTDERGLARLGGLEPGICEVSFPRIDGREWTRKGSSFRPGADTVERTHVVQPRECMSRIAHRFAFRSPDTLWTHECNRPLRDAGRSPDVLWPGDRVNILVRDDRLDEAETNRRHRFVVKTAVRWLRLVLHDVFRRPLASTAYVLALRGEKPIARTTNDSGLLEEIIPPSATEATITAGDYVWQVVIADVLPVDDVPDEGREGVLRRLRNLGCPAARPATERSLDAASSLDEGTSLDGAQEPEVFDADVFMHQLRVGWAASGQIDEPTRERVIDEYGV